MKRLIILRGNSGSGKTTVARMLQDQLSGRVMLLSQDMLRREILRVKEDSKHPTAELLQVMTRFGWSNGFETVIIEGIWGRKKEWLGGA
jgi:uridine kinase